MSRQNYVLRNETTELSLIDNLQEVLDLIHEKYGMWFIYAFFEEESDELGRHVYWESGKRAILSLVEDFDTPVRYLMIEAATETEVEHIANLLREFLNFIPLQELQETARQTMMEDPQALERMALAANSISDPVTVEILQDALLNNNIDVSKAAVAAIGQTQWTETLEYLESISQNNPSSEVRELAGQIVEAYQQIIQAQTSSEDVE